MRRRRLRVQYAILIDSGQTARRTTIARSSRSPRRRPTEFRCRVNGPGGAMGEYAAVHSPWPAPGRARRRCVLLPGGGARSTASRSTTASRSSRSTRRAAGAPTIESPAPGGQVHTSTSVPISGTGEPFATITIKVGDRVVGSDLRETIAGKRDAWTCAPTEPEGDQRPQRHGHRRGRATSPTPETRTIARVDDAAGRDDHERGRRCSATTSTRSSSSPPTSRPPRFQCRDYIPGRPARATSSTARRRTPARRDRRPAHLRGPRARRGTARRASRTRTRFTVDTVAAEPADDHGARRRHGPPRGRRDAPAARPSD